MPRGCVKRTPLRILNSFFVWTNNLDYSIVLSNTFIPSGYAVKPRAFDRNCRVGISKPAFCTLSILSNGEGRRFSILKDTPLKIGVEKSFSWTLVRASAWITGGEFSVGSTRVPSVRRDTPVVVGRPPRIGVASQSSKANLRCRTVVPTPADSSVPTVSRPRRVGCSRCVPSLSIKPCKPPANGKPRRNSKLPLLYAPGLKARSPKACGLAVYGKPAPVVWSKSISSRCSRPLRSISAGCMPGSLSNHAPKHGKLLSCALLKNELTISPPVIHALARTRVHENDFSTPIFRGVSLRMESHITSV